MTQVESSLKVKDWIIRQIDENAQIIIIGLGIALCFALGFAVLGYSKASTASKSAKSANHTAQELKANQNTINAAAYLACKNGKPKTTALISGLAFNYERTADNAVATLKLTKKGSPLYMRRKKAVTIDQAIVKTLNDYLPITCRKSTLP